MWDKINAAYTKRNQPVMYGLATDDSHSYHQFGSTFSNAGRGWVMVQASNLDAASLIEAMEAGRFYSSTGVTLDELLVTDNELTINIAKEAGVEYTIELIGLKTGVEETEIIQTIRVSELNYKLSNDYVFVRARITSTKPKENPFQEGDFEMAWTQPVLIKSP